MKRCIPLLCVVVILSIHAKADHITGGEMYYTRIGFANNEYLYKVTLKLFMRCNSGRQFANPTIISVFNKGSGVRVTDLSVPLINQNQISLVSNNPCITNPPIVCYEVGLYQVNMSLPPSPDGYVLASQVNYRIAGISNLEPGYGLIGATYTAEIPGTAAITSAPDNNGAHFTGSDLVIVCANNSMSYSFAAEDADGDLLQYSFCEAYQSGSGGQSGSPPPPPYVAVPYGLPFTGSSPLGGQVNINPNTGLITGLAPPAGIYVVTVCVNEIRNGILIATQRKDLQINITSCTIAAATLPPAYMLCKEGKSLTVSNLSVSPLIHTYYWEFSDRQGNLLHTSSSATTTFSFADTGLYQIKLVINRGEECSDSTLSFAYVYPGFVPAFDFTGICYSRPTVFTDKTTTIYGMVNAWSWDFGEPSSFADVSDQQHPTYTYPTQGSKEATLIVKNSNGCIDTIKKTVSVLEKPPINLAFRDTLICTPDAVQLQASGSGVFKWSPQINMIDPETPTPTVSPTSTITYYVDLNDNGCTNKDSVKVRVTDHVTIQAMNDTTICRGDTIQLRIVSDGFQYLWSPATSVIDPQVKNPFCFTHITTRYTVIARIGSCTAVEDIVVDPIPYPRADAGSDTVICHSGIAQLNGSTDGTSVSWAPANTLNNASILDPVAKPATTTTYTLSAYDVKGCPKPGTDAVVVTVLPDIHAYAGRDTSVVVGQVLQFLATGGIRYLWSPAIGLSATDIPNPVGKYNNESDLIHYRVLVYNEANCVDSAFISVKVFKTGPEVFVPNAFTPNADGHNDVLRPVVAGIRNIEYFKVFSRWGQLVFSSSETGRGWDGRIAGTLQPAGSYVWTVMAIDYKGDPVFRKGSALLIR
jgi:gliding motility-associated-like protein